MTDRTDHVPASIDGALHDFETSDDAMRWTPQPPVPAPARKAIELAHDVGLELRPWQENWLASMIAPGDALAARSHAARMRRAAITPPRRPGMEPGFTILDETRFLHALRDRARRRNQPLALAFSWDSLAASAEAALRAVEQAWADIVATCERSTEHINALNELAADAAQTPQQRALAAVRNRHTGPPRPRLDGRRAK